MGLRGRVRLCSGVGRGSIGGGAYNVPLVLDRVYPHRVACHFQQSTKREDGHVPGLVPVKGEVGDVEIGEEIEDQKEDGGWQRRGVHPDGALLEDLGGGDFGHFDGSLRENGETCVDGKDQAMH